MNRHLFTLAKTVAVFAALFWVLSLAKAGLTNIVRVKTNLD